MKEGQIFSHGKNKEEVISDVEEPEQGTSVSAGEEEDEEEEGTGVDPPTLDSYHNENLRSESRQEKTRVADKSVEKGEECSSDAAAAVETVNKERKEEEVIKGRVTSVGRKEEGAEREVREDIKEKEEKKNYEGKDNKEESGDANDDNDDISRLSLDFNLASLTIRQSNLISGDQDERGLNNVTEVGCFQRLETDRSLTSPSDSGFNSNWSLEYSGAFDNLDIVNNPVSTTTPEITKTTSETKTTTLETTTTAAATTTTRSRDEVDFKEIEKQDYEPRDNEQIILNNVGAGVDNSQSSEADINEINISQLIKTDQIKGGYLKVENQEVDEMSKQAIVRESSVDGLDTDLTSDLDAAFLSQQHNNLNASQNQQNTHTDKNHENLQTGESHRERTQRDIDQDLDDPYVTASDDDEDDHQEKEQDHIQKHEQEEQEHEKEQQEHGQEQQDHKQEQQEHEQEQQEHEHELGQGQEQPQQQQQHHPTSDTRWENDNDDDDMMDGEIAADNDVGKTRKQNIRQLDYNNFLPNEKHLTKIHTPSESEGEENEGEGVGGREEWKRRGLSPSDLEVAQLNSGSEAFRWRSDGDGVTASRDRVDDVINDNDDDSVGDVMEGIDVIGGKIVKGEICVADQKSSLISEGDKSFSKGGDDSSFSVNAWGLNTPIRDTTGRGAESWEGQGMRPSAEKVWGKPWGEFRNLGGNFGGEISPTRSSSSGSTFSLLEETFSSVSSTNEASVHRTSLANGTRRRKISFSDGICDLSRTNLELGSRSLDRFPSNPEQGLDGSHDLSRANPEQESRSVDRFRSNPEQGSKSHDFIRSNSEQVSRPCDRSPTSPVLRSRSSHHRVSADAKLAYEKSDPQRSTHYLMTSRTALRRPYYYTVIDAADDNDDGRAHPGVTYPRRAAPGGGFGSSVTPYFDSGFAANVSRVLAREELGRRLNELSMKYSSVVTRNAGCGRVGAGWECGVGSGGGGDVWREGIGLRRGGRVRPSVSVTKRCDNNKSYIGSSNITTSNTKNNDNDKSNGIRKQNSYKTTITAGNNIKDCSNKNNSINYSNSLGSISKIRHDSHCSTRNCSIGNSSSNNNTASVCLFDMRSSVAGSGSDLISDRCHDGVTSRHDMTMSTTLDNRRILGLEGDSQMSRGIDEEVLKGGGEKVGGREREITTVGGRAREVGEWMRDEVELRENLTLYRRLAAEHTTYAQLLRVIQTTDKRQGNVIKELKAQVGDLEKQIWRMERNYLQKDERSSRAAAVFNLY